MAKQTDYALLRRSAANEASRRLVDELVYHVRTVATEAQKGDYEARSWLCEAFPGHTKLFRSAWSGEAPQGRKRRNNSL